MFKFTGEGLVELGGINPLSEADLQCIAEDIAAHTAMPGMCKVNGVWRQRSSMNMMERGYRIHEIDEEEDTIAAINADLDAIESTRAFVEAVQDV